MTVSELITELQKCNPDLEVLAYDDYSDTGLAFDIDSVEIADGKDIEHADNRPLPVSVVVLHF